MINFHPRLTRSTYKEIDSMDREALLGEFREYLQAKRYIVALVDMENLDLCNDIEYALIDCHTPLRIVITTRIKEVADFLTKLSPELVCHTKPLDKQLT